MLILSQTPHHVQIYFYTLCLKYILDNNLFECSENAGVWLPPSDGFDVASPSLLDIKSIDLNLLSSPLDLLIFRRLPLLLAQRQDQVQWHFNPSCKAALANIIRLILVLQAGWGERNILTTQFYVWSANDQSILQANLIHAALSSDANVDDARLCIGALSQGAALLQTAYQPILLSGALLGFLSKKKRMKKEYQAYLLRMNLPTHGTAEDCRKRVEAAIIKLKEEKDNFLRTARKRRELGEVPRIVVLKREIERTFALPVAGYWDLQDCTVIMLPQKAVDKPPSEEELYRIFRHGTDAELSTSMKARNHAIHDVLMNMRERTRPPSGPQLLLNEAKVLSVNFMDLCRNVTLRKLFYMQQVNTRGPFEWNILKASSLRSWLS